MEATLAIQSALVKDLRAEGFRVFDFPPKENKAKYPFIMVGDDRESDLDVKNGVYVDVNSTILVFSTYNGKKEVNQILGQIKTIAMNLEPTGYEIVGSKVTDSFAILDDDNKVTQGVIEINFKMLKGE